MNTPQRSRKERELDSIQHYEELAENRPDEKTVKRFKHRPYEVGVEDKRKGDVGSG